MRKQFLVVLAVLASAFAFAQKGTLAGTITDKDLNNEPLPFANVLVKGTTNAVTTDDQGKYSISLDAGTYQIEYSFLGYETQTETVTIVANQTVTLDKTMGAGTYTLKDVQVQAQGNREKESALLLEQKKAVEIKQSIGAQELSRKGIGDVEEGLTKITGITKVGSRGLFVRGLEDRYNNLLVNDLAVPSNSPFQKIIPLDLFPTDIVSVVEVFKTFNSNIYGDFSGGTFNIATSKGGKSITKVGIGIGYTTDNNFSDFKISEDANTGKGFFGFTGKDREMPGVFGNTPSNLTLTSQQSQNAFKSGFNVDRTKSPLNSSINFLHSERFDLESGAKFTYLLSLSGDNSYQIRKGPDRTLMGSSTEIEFNNDFMSYDYKYKTNSSALIGANYKNDRLDLAFTAFYLRNTENSIRDQIGVLDNQENTPNYMLRTSQLDQSDYVTGQLQGKYFLNSDKSQTLRAGVSFSNTSYQQPDRKFFGGARQGDDSILTSYGGNNFLRQYFDINGNLYVSGMAEYALKFGGEEKRHQFTFGYNGNMSDTETSYRFVSVTNGNAGSFPTSIDNIDAQIQTDLAANAFSFRESSNAQYKSKLHEAVNAGYANLLLHFGEKWEINGGVRVEQASRETKYRENGSFSDPFLVKKFDKTYVLPAVNMKYALTEKANLRLAVGETYTKPVLIEALPLTYINADGTSVSGNPFVENSDNWNADLKYEFFPTSTEMFALGVFGKKIDNAIERSFQANAGGFVTTFFNTGDATLYGAELEFIFDFNRVSEQLKNFSLGFNTSVMQTSIDVNKFVTNSNGTRTESVETHRDRELQGASKWLINSDLKYQFQFSEKWTNTISAVYSVFGKRIFSVGTIPFDHIYELPVSKLDIVWSSKVSEHIDLKLTADNILNPKVRFEIGDESKAEYTETSRVLSQFKRGTGFALSLNYTF